MGNVARTAHERRGQGDGAGGVFRVAIRFRSFRLESCSRRCARAGSSSFSPRGPNLHDLASDPDEATNLYGQRAALATALTRRLEEIEPPAEAQRAADVPALDSDTRARLAALGYVSLPAPRAPVDAGARLPDPKDHIDLYRQFTERSQHPERTPMNRTCLAVISVSHRRGVR